MISELVEFACEHPAEFAPVCGAMPRGHSVDSLFAFNNRCMLCARLEWARAPLPKGRAGGALAHTTAFHVFHIRGHDADGFGRGDARAHRSTCAPRTGAQRLTRASARPRRSRPRRNRWLAHAPALIGCVFLSFRSAPRLWRANTSTRLSTGSSARLFSFTHTVMKIFEIKIEF